MALDIETLAGNLKKYRLTKKMTQQELADRLLVSAQSVSKWECGQSVPELDKLCAAADILGITVDTLLENRPSYDRLLIGVDGGGTKTEFLLFRENGQILKRLVLEGANPNVCGVERTLQILQTGIDQLLEPGTWASGIFVGCAGFFSGNYGKQIKTALQERYPRSLIECSSDIMNIIASGSDSQRCIAVICGTGSVICANEKRTLHNLGGAGYLLDKQGSGFDIGRDVLQIALREQDGYGEKSLITPLVTEKLGGSVRDRIREIYRQGNAFIASFAPIAFAAHAKGDPAAEKILREHAGYLAEMITAASRLYRCGETVTLAGSIFTNNPVFVRMVKENLPSGLRLEIPPYPPVFGACVLACELCDVYPQPLREDFVAQYQLYL